MQDTYLFKHTLFLTHALLTFLCVRYMVCMAVISSVPQSHISLLHQYSKYTKSCSVLCFPYPYISFQYMQYYVTRYLKLIVLMRLSRLISPTLMEMTLVQLFPHPSKTTTRGAGLLQVVITNYNKTFIVQKLMAEMACFVAYYCRAPL